MRRALTIWVLLCTTIGLSSCEHLVVGSHGVWANSETYVVGYECPAIQGASRALDRALWDADHKPADVRTQLILAYSDIDQYINSADTRSLQSLQKLAGDIDSAIRAWTPPSTLLGRQVEVTEKLRAMVRIPERYADVIEAYC